MISGKNTFLFVYERWPMDLWATLLFFIAVGLMFPIMYMQRNPESWGKFRCRIDGWISIVGIFLVKLITLRWLLVVIHGLFFTLNEKKGKHEFDPYRTMFILASGIILFRLLVGGSAFEGVMIGPNVENTVAKIQMKGSLYQGQRAYITVQKFAMAAIAFYELLVLIVFAALFFTRFDLEEGDQSNGLRSASPMLWKAIAQRVSGGSSPGNESAILTNSDSSVKNQISNVDEGIATGEPIVISGSPSRMKKTEIVEIKIKDDPFKK